VYSRVSAGQAIVRGSPIRSAPDLPSLPLAAQSFSAVSFLGTIHLGDYVLHNVSVYVGEAEVAAGVAVSQAEVVETQ
jgi:hypothetical protein